MSEEAIETSVEDTLESVARRMGWDHEGERSAGEFVFTTNKMLKKSSNSNKELLAKMDAMQTKMENMAMDTSRQTKQALEAQRSRLQDERKQAIEEGDTEKFSRVDKEMQDISKVQNEVAINVAPVVDPNVQQLENLFQSRNEWYKGSSAEDVVMTSDARILAQGIAADFPNLQGEEFLEKIEESMKIKYPAYFSSPAHKPTGVAPDKPQKKRASSKWDELVAEYPEIKDIFAKNVKEGLFKDDDAGREKYASGVK